MPDANGKLTDADVMTGFNPDRALTAEDIAAQQADAEPSGDAPEGTQAPTDDALVDVNLDGRTVKAPREVADAFTQALSRARDITAGTRGSELQSLRERLARLEGAASAGDAAKPDAPPEPQVPSPELQIENPEEYQRQLLTYIDRQQEKRATGLAQQYEEAEAAKDQEARRRAAWSNHVESFYALPENEVLRDNRDIVDLVLAQNKDTLAPLSVQEGFKALGDLARARLAKLTGVAPKVRSRAQKPPTLEGSARRDSAVTPTPGNESPASLTQALRERRKQAASAFQKGGQRSAAPAA